MKTRILVAASAALIGPLLLVGGVYAARQSGAQGGEGQVVVQTDTTQTTNGQTPPSDQSTLQQRLEQRKSETKVRVAGAELKRLQQRCKPAQANVKKVGDKVKANIPQRHRAYENLAERLTKLIEKLDAQGVATADLKSQQTELNQKIATYKTDIEKYQQALDDLSAMDCAQDPTAFKASLESARKLREGLAKSIADIRTYVVDTVKPTLVEVRKSLADKEGES